MSQMHAISQLVGTPPNPLRFIEQFSEGLAHNLFTVLSQAGRADKTH